MTIRFKPTDELFAATGGVPEGYRARLNGIEENVGRVGTTSAIESDNSAIGVTMVSEKSEETINATEHNIPPEGESVSNKNPNVIPPEIYMTERQKQERLRQTSAQSSTPQTAARGANGKTTHSSDTTALSLEDIRNLYFGADKESAEQERPTATIVSDTKTPESTITRSPKNKRKYKAAGVMVVAALPLVIGQVLGGDTTTQDQTTDTIGTKTPPSSSGEPFTSQGPLGDRIDGSDSSIAPPNDAAPTEFTVPNSISVGDSSGCVELLQPTVAGSTFGFDNIDKTPEGGPSYLKAVVEGRDYWIKIQKGGIRYVLSACGVNELSVSAEPAGISDSDVVQQTATVSTASISGTGARVNEGDQPRILSTDEYYKEVKDWPVGTCKFYNGYNCETVTTIPEDTQNKIIASAFYGIAQQVEVYCADDANTLLRKDIRAAIKTNVVDQNIPGVSKDDISVSFSGNDKLTFLDEELSVSANSGLGSADEMLAVFPGLKTNQLLVQGCTK